MTVPDMQWTYEPTDAAEENLRATHYNATLARVLPIHSDLRILRVVPDQGVPDYLPGQFLTLGLGNWEPRVEGVDDEHLDSRRRTRLAKRAYSISCSLVDYQGVLRRAAEFPYLEFYVTLVRHGTKHPPALTPRLFALQAGDRLFVERRAAGTYTLAGVRPTDTVFFIATGTGEAPHNAMIAELLARRHRGHIVNVVSVRYLRDAAYRRIHQRLAERYPNYHSLVLATREPAGDRLPQDGWVGGCRLQPLVRSCQLEEMVGVPLDPAQAQVFLCGNPEMIGAAHPTDASALAKSGSMLELLLRRGFQCDQPGRRGSVHFERYW